MCLKWKKIPEENSSNATPTINISSIVEVKRRTNYRSVLFSCKLIYGSVLFDVQRELLPS